MYNKDIEDDDTDASINIEYLSETTPLNSNTRLSASKRSTDEILSSSLLVEMKNLKNKKISNPTLFRFKNATNKVPKGIKDIEKGNLEPQVVDNETNGQNGINKADVLPLWQKTLNIDQLLIQVILRTYFQFLDLRLL